MCVCVCVRVCVCVCVCYTFSHVRLFETLWTVAHQVPLAMEFASKNPGLGCHSLPQGNLPNPGIKPGPPTLQADSLPSEL